MGGEIGVKSTRDGEIKKNRWGSGGGGGGGSLHGTVLVA